MRGGKFLICLMLTSLVFTGCTLFPRGRIKEDPRTRGEGQFDPLGFPQDRVIVTEEEPGRKEEGASELEKVRGFKAEEPAGEKDLLSRKIYRVQFFAT